MMRFVGILSTATLIFLVGFGTGASIAGKHMYVAGAKDAFTRCLEMSENKLEVSETKPDHATITSRRIRCGAGVLLSYGLDVE